MKAFFLELGEELERASSVLDQGTKLGPRVSVETAHRALEQAITVSSDVDLGLRASRRLLAGDVGAFDYVVNSSETVRSALAAARRFGPLINDIVTVGVEVDGDTCLVRLDSSMQVPRAALDFTIASFHRHHIRRWFPSRLAAVGVWFTYPVPSSIVEHERTFAPSNVRFSAPHAGFVFDAAYLDLPLGDADARLHAILGEYAETRLETLARVATLTSEIRKILLEDFPHRDLAITRIGAHFNLTPRTLARHLKREGTSYAEILDDVRRELATKYVENQSLPLLQLAKVLQFSHPASFHRAFRRWTGLTPLQFRKAQRP